MKNSTTKAAAAATMKTTTHQVGEKAVVKVTHINNGKEEKGRKDYILKSTTLKW